MGTKFRERGYPASILQPEPVDPTRARLDKSDRIAFIHTYHPFTYILHKTIRKHWNILRTGYPSITSFQKPFMPCFKRAQNLKDSLIRADIGTSKSKPIQRFLQNPKTGTFPCLQCRQCNNVLKGNIIYHPQTGKKYNIKGFYTCESAFMLSIPRVSSLVLLCASRTIKQSFIGPSKDFCPPILPQSIFCRELYRIMEFVRNMERRRLIKPQDILATLQSIPEDESESELQEHVFDSDSDEDFIPQNISSESEDSEGTNPEDIPSTSTGDRAHAVMLPRDHPPGRGQKKSAKRPRNERTTDNDGGEGNATTNTREGESEGILVSADGIQWKPVEIGEHLPGRRDSQNILREAPGPTGYARRNIIIDSPLSAWRLFFDSYILTHIKNCTLAEACRNNNLQFTLSDEELDAFTAIFYARGISGTNRHSISSIWCNDWGIPFCKATMSRDRFVEIMRFLSFDEKSTRSERLQTDKFALFSTVWDRFIENCIACYKPGPYITVVEQLFPSKTRCPFTQYMPSKPDKYGHKYWLAVDKRSKYLANGFPYLGKDDTRRAGDRLADHVVMKLLDPFLKKGRNVTTDNYFTSVKLAKQLKSKGTTIVGTLNKIRREVPKEIKSMKEELYNTKVFRNEDNFTLTVYQGKPNKNVVILSSVHPDVVVASDSAKKTPETVKFYNETKYGVDVVDQMARKYTTRTCTRRWPVHAFENALDFAGINAWIIFKEITHQKMSRKAFLQTLVRELSVPYVTDREKGSTSQVSTCSEVMVQTKFCQIKEKCKKNRSVGNCKTCGKSLCGQCTAINQRQCLKCETPNV
ncbi:uncharacterized protein [Phyllobates terribilis]|uniref:uncharacterized protein n=1 Tax=Phyllobates terribilis TaxID=111132 RepID=UPI003CCB005E